MIPSERSRDDGTFLVQHGKSLAKEQDPEQGLSEEGIADTERIAGVAKGYGIRPTCIAHSGKKRARQTAEIFAAALQPDKGVQERTGLNPWTNWGRLPPPWTARRI